MPNSARVQTPKALNLKLDVDAGELEAICLAQEIKAAAILMDDRAGRSAAIRCGLDFFGVDQVLFASDSPFDPEKGAGYIRETIRCVDVLDVSEGDRRKIYEGNARRLIRLKLPS